MEIIYINVDGISDTIEFELQEDGWYLNNQYHLLIDPEVTYCITSQDSEFSCLPIIQFRVIEHDYQ